MSKSNSRYWSSPVPPTDDFDLPLTRVLIDAKTKYGPWALITEASFLTHGCGKLGLGWANDISCSRMVAGCTRRTCPTCRLRALPNAPAGLL
jgi:hypothetical protein